MNKAFRVKTITTALVLAFALVVPYTAFADEAAGSIDGLSSEVQLSAAGQTVDEKALSDSGKVAVANKGDSNGEEAKSSKADAGESNESNAGISENEAVRSLEAEQTTTDAKGNAKSVDERSNSDSGAVKGSGVSEVTVKANGVNASKDKLEQPTGGQAKQNDERASGNTAEQGAAKKKSDVKTSTVKSSSEKAEAAKTASCQVATPEPAAAKATAKGAAHPKAVEGKQPASKQLGKTTMPKQQSKVASTTKHKTSLAEGTYMIVTAKSTKRVLDVAGGSKANGANVLLWDWHGAAWQKWKVSYDSEGYYTIKNVHTGKVLDVAGLNARSGANVLSWQEKATKNANQRWVLEKSGAGYILKSALNQSLALDCTGNSAANGTNIEIWKANGQPNQRFIFVNLNPDVARGKTLEDGIYTMGVSNKPTQLVEVQGKSIRNDANVDLYASNKGMNQRWSFQYNGDGLYRVVNIGSGLSLDVEGANPTAGTNVLQYAANTGKNQLWGITQNADGTYTLYSALNGMALDVHGVSTANLANLEVYYPRNAANQKFVLSKASENYSGTYQIITRLSQNPKLLDVPNDSVSDGAQLALWGANEGLNQRYLFEKVGSSYSIRPVSSGKYLTALGGKVVQASAKGKAGSASENQLWTLEYSKNGFQIQNVGTGKVMSVAGSKAVNSAKIQETVWGGKTAQKFLLSRSEMIPRGLYVVHNLANPSLAIDASEGSFANGANAIVFNSSGMNNQKFAIAPVEGGYYRITLALGGTVLGARGGNGASAKLYSWTGADDQLWKPVLTDGGISLQNKKSGMQLAAAGKSSGSDAIQKKPSKTDLQTWRFSKSRINHSDMGSFVKCLDLTSGSGVPTVTRAVPGFSTSSSQWHALWDAMDQCWNAGFDVGFISVDCNTGMTISANADSTFYGASTIKGLYITYLCEELLETGAISLGSVEDLMYDTIVYSNNDTYSTLRYNYGSQSGFNAWLSDIGVGELGLYDYYTPKTLAKAWTHILEYERSNGSYVGFWRSIFDHGHMSSINDALECTVYSKPGWFDGGSIGYILDDAGIVKNSSGTYVLAVMSDAYPYNWQKDTIENLVRAINDVHSSIPATR